MTDNTTTIDGLPPASTPLTGAEEVPIWQSGATVKVPVSAIGGSISGSGTTNYIAKFTGTSTLGNSLISDNGVANVGVNLSPDFGAALQVGQGSAVYGLGVYDTTGLASTNGFFALTHSGSGSFLSTYFDTNIGADTLRFGTDGSVRMVIDHYGSVGIGTVTPGALLDVAGTTRLGAVGTDTITLRGQVSANSSVGTSGQLLTSRGANLSPQWASTSSAGKTSVTTITILAANTYTSGGVTFASQTAAANSTWRVRAFGTFTTINSATARNALIACFWGSTQLAAISTTILIGAVQTTQWQVEFTLTASSTTAIWTAGTFLNQIAAAIATPALTIANVTPASTTVTAGAQTIDLKFASSQNVGDSWAVQSVTIERLV
jgi:hypothetical protein